MSEQPAQIKANEHLILTPGQLYSVLRVSGSLGVDWLLTLAGSDENNLQTNPIISFDIFLEVAQIVPQDIDRLLGSCGHLIKSPYQLVSFLKICPPEKMPVLLESCKSLIKEALQYFDSCDEEESDLEDEEERKQEQDAFAGDDKEPLMRFVRFLLDKLFPLRRDPPSSGSAPKSLDEEEESSELALRFVEDRRAETFVDIFLQFPGFSEKREEIFTLAGKDSFDSYFRPLLELLSKIGTLPAKLVFSSILVRHLALRLPRKAFSDNEIEDISLVTKYLCEIIVGVGEQPNIIEPVKLLLIQLEGVFFPEERGGWLDSETEETPPPSSKEALTAFYTPLIALGKQLFPSLGTNEAIQAMLRPAVVGRKFSMEPSEKRAAHLSIVNPTKTVDPTLFSPASSPPSLPLSSSQAFARRNLTKP